MKSILQSVAIFAIAVTLLTISYMVGYIEHMILIDTTYICISIIALTFGFVMYSIFNIIILSINPIENEIQYLEYNRKLNVIYNAMELMPILGIIGTVIGFMILMSGFGNLNITDVDAAKQMIATMGSGLGIALVTTLVGMLGACILRFQALVLYNAIEENYNSVEDK